MKINILVFGLFVYIVLIFNLINVSAISHGKSKRGLVARGEKGHLHLAEDPCAVCPRHGRCAPKVQCPAHLRPGSHNPLCHLDKETNSIGVCCFTGSAHASEPDHKYRATSGVTIEDTKRANNYSHHTLNEWMKKTAKLLHEPEKTIVDMASPSYAHHLSVVSFDPRVEQLGRGGLLNLLASKEMKARQVVSDEGILLGLTDHTDGPFCPPQPNCPRTPTRYRTIGGECNNPSFPSWGAVNTGFERLLPPDYSDGLWAMRTSTSGLPLPSARLVSHQLLLDSNHPSHSHNLMFMQFGQFIAHDISSGVVFTHGNGSAISCCFGDGEDFLPPELQHFACAPIAVLHNDIFFGQFRHSCLNFVRTVLAPDADCRLGYAKQMNGATHYLDLSHLYGSTTQKVNSLRAPGGLLKTFNDYGRELPPLTERKECLTTKKGAACFESGDNHGNQIISLTVLHTIWTREHNRIARVLSRLNPDWKEDTIFMETRRIVQAEYQHIVYNEWLPLLLGPQIVEIFGLAPAPGYSKQYDSNVNPTLTAEFAVAAMRFGHSVVDGKMIVPTSVRSDLYETLSIPEVMFEPGRLRLRPFLDRMLAGLSWQPMQTVDPFISESLTRYLFHGGNPYGIDLASINIQRGRDYGIRSYNEYRRLSGLEPFVNFKQFASKTAQRLSSVYSNPEDIDLWVGGLLEKPVDGGIVGATFANILADQFSRIKRGDSYFYENGPDVNAGAFTPSQLTEIKKVTLSRIICDNSDRFELNTQPPAAFLRSDLPGNEPVPCDSALIPAVDFSRFREI